MVVSIREVGHETAPVVGLIVNTLARGVGRVPCKLPRFRHKLVQRLDIAPVEVVNKCLDELANAGLRTDGSVC
jgi:hypothetical protein